MKDNQKELSELTHLLKWQIDMGAEAMMEEKKNKFLPKKVIKKEINYKIKDLDEQYLGTIEIKFDNEHYKQNIKKDYLKVIKNCTNLNMLKEAMHNFDECDLKKTATQLVFADGNPSSKIMFIEKLLDLKRIVKEDPFVGQVANF